MTITNKCRACKICGSQLYLEVHHLTYFDNEGKSITGNEKQHLDKLVLLCSKCHEHVHKNLNHSFNPRNYAKTK